MDFDDLLNGYNARSKIKLNETSNSNSSNNMWGAIISAIAGLVGSVMQNTKNTKQIQATNQANRELVQMQNKASAQEAEKAYQRSLPINQVNTMQAAGMSKAGAINALNGGGSYQPAPVNVSQDTAPQVDYTTAINAMQSFAQLQEQKRQFNAQQRLERDKFEFEKKRTITNDGYDNIVKTFQAAKLNSEAMSANLDYLVKEFTQNERIDAEKQRLIAEKAKSLADALQQKLYKGALDDVDDETLKALFKYQAMLELVGNIGNMSLEKAIGVLHDIKEIFIPG